MYVFCSDDLIRSEQLAVQEVNDRFQLLDRHWERHE